MITAGNVVKKTHIVVDDKKGNIGVASAVAPNTNIMGATGTGTGGGGGGSAAAAGVAPSPKSGDGKWRPTTLSNASADQKRAMLHSLLDENTTKIRIAQEAESAATASGKSARRGGGATCVECEEAAAVVQCVQCTDVYCQVCFTSMHRFVPPPHRTTTRCHLLSSLADSLSYVYVL